MKPTIEILERMKENSEKNKEEVFTRLYRYLLRPDLYFIAYQKLYSNNGAATEGVNRDTADGFSEAKVEKLIASLADESYCPKPSRRIYLKKPNGKRRPLGIPSFSDKLVQEVLRMVLEAVYEPIFLETSHGFRPGKSCHTALCYARYNLNGTRWFIEGDIKGCFDNISHEWILSNIPMDKDILRKWLKSGYIETGKLFPTDLGSPQGSAISPTICNMVLDGLEAKIKEKYHKTKSNGKSYFPKVNFIRYADDFIVTGESRKLLENGVLPIIRDFLSERGLELSEEKTVITHIEDGFDFLGTNIRWYKDKLLTKPSKKNYKAIISKVRGIIKQNPSMKQEDLIRKLNPVIRGWVNFHKYNVSTDAFERFDFDVWRCLWRWCKRRHPRKSHKWIAKRYFRQVGTRIWTFSVKTSDSFELNLIYATDTKIVRWLKTKSEATPFDARYAEYFEDRETERMFREIGGRKKLNALYKTQGGICPYCKEAITVEKGFRIHTVIGGDFKERKFLLHAACHRFIHYSKNVDEPALVMQGL